MESSRQRASGAPTPRFRLLATPRLCFICAISLLFADDAVTLSFPDNSQRYAWVQDGYPNSLPKDPVSVVSTQIQLAIPAKTPGARVFVWDKKLGTVAERQISSLQDANWDVKPTDYTEFAEVHLSVEYGGKPVAAASVDLKDVTRTQSQVLDSSANGVLSFYMVKIGKIGASVSYRSNGAMAAPVQQSFDLAPTTDPVPTFKIAVPGPVETVSGTAASSPAVGSTTAPPAAAPGAAIAAPVAPPPAPACKTNPVGSPGGRRDRLGHRSGSRLRGHHVGQEESRNGEGQV